MSPKNVEYVQKTITLALASEYCGPDDSSLMIRRTRQGFASFLSFKPSKFHHSILITSPIIVPPSRNKMVRVLPAYLQLSPAISSCSSLPASPLPPSSPQNNSQANPPPPSASPLANKKTAQARNSEKAQSMLFRFRAQQAASLGILDISRARRPKAITSITAIPVCEKWRGQVLKEISRKVSKIQETSLSDFQVRDLNDEINKLMREKHMWEAQIRGLGGPNYMRGGGRVLDDDGREIEGGGRGYRYDVFFLYETSPVTFRTRPQTS